MKKTTTPTQSWTETHIVKGIKLRTVPQAGHAAYHGINGDTYGYIIVEVAADGTWFTYSRTTDGRVEGKAWLCTRKGSPLRGCYIRADLSTVGNSLDRKPTMNYRYDRYNTIWPSEEIGLGKTTLDPSF